MIRVLRNDAPPTNFLLIAGYQRNKWEQVLKKKKKKKKKKKIQHISVIYTTICYI